MSMDGSKILRKRPRTPSFGFKLDSIQQRHLGWWIMKICQIPGNVSLITLISCYSKWVGVQYRRVRESQNLFVYEVFFALIRTDIKLFLTVSMCFRVNKYGNSLMQYKRAIYIFRNTRNIHNSHCFFFYF